MYGLKSHYFNTFNTPGKIMPQITGEYRYMAKDIMDIHMYDHTLRDIQTYKCTERHMTDESVAG